MGIGPHFSSSDLFDVRQMSSMMFNSMLMAQEIYYDVLIHGKAAVCPCRM